VVGVGVARAGCSGRRRTFAGTTARWDCEGALVPRRAQWRIGPLPCRGLLHTHIALQGEVLGFSVAMIGILTSAYYTGFLVGT
jgi:hypothetical protein